MDPNTHSPQPPTGRPGGPADGRPDRLASVAAANVELAAEDLDRLSEVALAEDAVRLRQLLDGLEGQWLRRVAAVDARGAAGADQGEEVASTAAWLRRRLRMGAGAARSAVRTARALFGGPLAETAAALVAGEVPLAHARVVADGIQDLAAQVAAEAEPVLMEAGRRLDPPAAPACPASGPGRRSRGGRPPSAAAPRAPRLMDLTHLGGMVAVDGLLESEAGSMVLAALEPSARPADAADTRNGVSGLLMPWPSWPAGPCMGVGCGRRVGSARL